MITRRKFLFGIISLAAGTVAASQLPVFKNDNGELEVEMKGTDNVTLRVPYNFRIRSILPEDTIVYSDENIVGVGSVLVSGNSLDIYSTLEDSQVKISVVKL